MHFRDATRRPLSGLAKTRLKLDEFGRSDRPIWSRLGLGLEREAKRHYNWRRGRRLLIGSRQTGAANFCPPRPARSKA